MKEEKINEASVEEVVGETSVQESSTEQQKIKNLISLSVLLAGLFFGSLFVDLSQLVTGGGISKKIIEGEDIFNLNERTWVAYDEPIVSLEVITDDTCKECESGEVLMQLRQMIPTMVVSEVDVKTKEGEKRLEEIGVKAIPAFVFSEEIEKTNFFYQAYSILDENDGDYVLNSIAAGIPVGKYIELPEVGGNDIVYGPEDAKVTLIEYSDFQCPYCKMYHETIKQVVEKYEGNVRFVFKQLPLPFHTNAMPASLAAECANEQGKFIEYADRLFANQKDWGSAEDPEKFFKGYASGIGLNSKEFGVCLDEERYSQKVAENVSEAQEFGISGTPAVFVNDQFQSGALKLEDLSEIIDEELKGDLQENEGEENVKALLEEVSDEGEETEE